MRRAGIGIVALMVWAGLQPAGAVPDAAVEIRFVAPERYTDADDRYGSGPSLRGTLSEIRRILELSARLVMASGDRLTIDVLDIDRAGFVTPGFSGPSSVRVVNDVTPPAFRLRYDLRRAGRRIASGEERVRDINYLFGARAARTGGFAYEETLLRDWARRRLAVP